MTPKDLAAELNGIEYSTVALLHGDLLMERAKAAGIVIAYGYSDDLLELDGALYDEGGAPGTSLIDAKGLLPSFESASESEEACRRYFERKLNAREIEAIWRNHPSGEMGDSAWVIKTDIPHEAFIIMEDGEPFSRGIVFSLSEITSGTNKKEPQPHE